MTLTVLIFLLGLNDFSMGHSWAQLLNTYVKLFDQETLTLETVETSQDIFCLDNLLMEM